MIIELDKEKNSRLNISVSHDKSGRYRLYVRQEFVEQRDGYESVVCYPFADGNFVATVKEGRKSAKQLDLMEQHLIKNAEKLKQLWLENDYENMVALVVGGIK
jgi:hypothetical protein